jgi:hypothetical protein
LTKLAEPVRPVLVAVHVLCTSSASTGPGPIPPGPSLVGRLGDAGSLPGNSVALSRKKSTELVADPVGPIVPWVFTLIGPDGGAGLQQSAGHLPAKIMAGP